MHRHNISITMLQIVIKVVSSKPIVLSDATFIFCLSHLLSCLSNPVGGGGVLQRVGPDPGFLTS